MKATVEAIKKFIGEPRNYGPTPEERAEMERIAQEERVMYFVLVRLVFATMNDVLVA